MTKEKAKLSEEETQMMKIKLGVFRETESEFLKAREQYEAMAFSFNSTIAMLGKRHGLEGPVRLNKDYELEVVKQEVAKDAKGK